MLRSVAGALAALVRAGGERVVPAGEREHWLERLLRWECSDGAPEALRCACANALGALADQPTEAGLQVRPFCKPHLTQKLLKCMLIWTRVPS